jgi:hypothetical protein
LEVTQSDGTTILAKIDSGGSITSAGLTTTGTSYILLGSPGSTGGNIVFATTGGTQSLIASTGGLGSQTLPSAAGTLLNSATTSIPNVNTANGLTSASSLATVGTITSGTWNATAIDISKGGTGTTYGSPLVGKSFLTATVTKANNTDVIPEAVFRTGTASSTIKWFSVKADTTYAFDGFIQIGVTANATGAAARMSLLYYSDKGTTTLTAQDVILRGVSNYGVASYIGAISVLAANTNADTGFTSTAATNHYIAFRGHIRTNASTAGYINLGACQSVVGSSTAPSFIGGAYMNIYEIGTGAIQTFGAWS